MSAILMMIFCVGCSQSTVGDLKMEAESVELGSAESVVVDLQIGVGELRISSGARKLLEADFIYNVAEWKPEVKYEIKGNQGMLRIKQSSFGTNAMGRARNEWNLTLSNKVPLDLKIETKVGKSTFDLGGLNLTSLDVQTGVGETTLDFLGDWKRDLHASIKGGIGEVALHLPDKVGVRVETEKAIGSVDAIGLKKQDNAFVNEAFGKSKVTLNFQIQAGIGAIRLEVGGIQSLIFIHHPQS
jgi:hypothetical protein